MKMSMLLSVVVVFQALTSNLQAREDVSEYQQKRLQVAKKVNSIIINDFSHGSESELKDQIKVLKEVKETDQRYNCLFLEVEPKASLAIDKFVAGTPYEESVSLWIDESNRKIKSPFKNIIPGWYLLQAHQLGFKIVGVDVEWSSEIGKKIIPLVKRLNENANIEEYGELLVGERSKIMATNVISHLRSDICDKGILVVGSGHLEAFIYKPIQQYFKEANITGFVW